MWLSFIKSWVEDFPTSEFNISLDFSMKYIYQNSICVCTRTNCAILASPYPALLSHRAKFRRIKKFLCNYGYNLWKYSSANPASEPRAFWIHGFYEYRKLQKEDIANFVPKLKNSTTFVLEQPNPRSYHHPRSYHDTNHIMICIG